MKSLSQASPLNVVLFIIALAALTLALSLTGCQTSKGFGKDVERLGDNIQKNAD
jgi:predicted small secreted protein